MSQRFEDRNKGFMQAVDQESLQAKRNEHVVELRRAKRFDHTRKRRIEMIQIEKPLSIDIQSLHPCLKSISDPCTALECYRKVLVSDCPQDLKLEALNLSRKLISDKPNPDLSFHYSLGFFQIYLSYLDLDYPKSFKIEASWALCNIANGDRFYVQEILNLGMIGKCVEALSVESLDLTENLIWALANIAGDCIEFRAQIINTEALDALISYFETVILQRSFTIVKTLVWAFSNISISAKSISVEKLGRIIALVSKLINSPNQDIRNYCLWILYYSTSSTNEKIQLVIDAGLLPSVCNYCGSQSNKENYVAVKILGNVLSGNENQAQMAIDIGSMDKLAHSISSNDALIRREGYWALSNLVAGTVTQLHVFLNNNIKNLAFNGIKDLDLQVKYEASVMVANICLRADHTIAYDMVKLGLLVFLKENLTKLTQEKILINLLRISDGLLKAQKSFNEAGNDMVNLFDSSGCLDQLLSLENHSSSKILSKVHEILQKHFKIEDDKEIRPQVTAMFDFS